MSEKPADSARYVDREVLVSYIEAALAFLSKRMRDSGEYPEWYMDMLDARHIVPAIIR